MNTQKSRKGFTLVELLVAVTIIAILSVTAFVAFGGQTLRARNAKRQEHLTSLQSALELYFSNENEYPATTLLLEGALVPNFISTIPADPSGGAYAYSAAANLRSYQLATTLEEDDPNTANDFTALVVGNGINLINGFQADGTTPCNDVETTPANEGVENEDSNCFPYIP